MTDDATTSEPDGSQRSAGRDLSLAIASGVLLAGAFLGSLFWHPAAFSAVVMALVVVGLAETSRTFARAEQPVAVPVVLVASAVMIAGAYRAERVGQVVGVVTLFLGATAWELADPDRRAVVRTIGNTLFLGLWVGFLASFAVLLVLREEEPVASVLAVVGAAIFTDIGAYVAGTALGRHRIAPTVSPKKTWEGLIGGLLTAAVLAAVVLPLVGDVFDDPLVAAGIAVLSGLAGFFGDLFESMFKRDLGVKDMGNVIPGHGGVLDRVDGILLALPVGYYALELFT